MITRPVNYSTFSEDSTAYEIVIRLLDENFDPVIDPGLGDGEGEEIYFTSDAVMGDTLTITSGMCEPGSVHFGGVVAESFECVLYLPYEDSYLYLEDATYMEVWFGVPDYPLYDISAYIRKGQYRFTVERTDSGLTKISGYDDLANDYFNTPLTQFYGQTLGTSTTTASQALTLIGVSYVADSSWGDIVVGAMDFSKDGGFENCTRRDVLSWICQLSGRFARIIDGTVTLVQCFSASAETFVIDKATGDPSIDISKPAITGVIIESTSGEVFTSGADGNYIVVKENPFLTGKTAAQKTACQARADALFNLVSGQTAYPFTLTWQGDPTLQPGDIVQFEIRTMSGTQTVTARADSVTYTHNGNCSISMDAGEECATEDAVAWSPTSSSKQYGFNSGDVYSSTFYGYGYTPSGSGYAYIEIPLTKPINASTVTITAGTNMAVRGTTGLMKSGSLADFTIVNTSINAGGFRIQMSGLTTHFTAQTPVSFVGNLTLSFS